MKTTLALTALLVFGAGMTARPAARSGESAVAAPHWSLRPLRPLSAVAVPEVRDESWCRTPIDRFVLSRIEGQGMTPSPEAGKSQWLRRVYFDLTGLPPTPQELAEFQNDPSPEAQDRVVDRLLARPEYGERWARHWLDAVHYAETHGHDQDRPRTNAWPYRDYVIASLNHDKPYARFVQEQIAGDVLFAEEAEAVVGLGFLATGPWDESSLRDIREESIDRQIARYIDRDDIVSTVMNTFVSATVQCARCHDHKFDPITQQEYYRLQSVFAGTDKANRAYDTEPRVHRERQRLLARKRQLETKPEAMADELGSAEFQQQVTAWEHSRQAQAAGRWEVLQPLTAVSSNGATLSIQSDGSILSGGPRPATDTCTLTTAAKTGGGVVTAIRLEVLPDASLPQNGPGRMDNGNLHLTDFKLYALGEAGSGPAAAASMSSMALALTNASADFNQEGWAIGKAIDADAQSAWGIFPEVGRRHEAVFEVVPQEPHQSDQSNQQHQQPARYQFVLAQNHGGGHLLGRWRLSATTAAPPIRASSLPGAIEEILGVAPAARSSEQKWRLAVHVARELNQAQLAALPPPKWVYAGASDFVPDGSFKPAGQPRAVHLLRRGDIRLAGAAMEPGALGMIPGLPGQFQLPDLDDEGARRAALARWITDPRNGLAWRSVVNRVWHHHFGRGLVNTPNDFGRMGGEPSHPELLDWLARWFESEGGSLKKLHRLILGSAVYRQASQDRPEYSSRDAENILLWRMNRTRLEAEVVRDTILQLSGRLDRRMGGPSAQQFVLSPGVHVTPKVDYARFDVDRAESRRRSVYRFVFRTLPDPFMESLDCPDASQLTPVRNSSVTAGQALAMLNDPFVVRYSEHFGERLAREFPDNSAERVRAAVRLVLGREARPEEAAKLRAFAEEFGWPNLARVLFNANEFIFVP